MLETKHHWLPVILPIHMVVSLVITYGIAVYNDHVEPVFPYISDTGAYPVESCIFSQLFNIGAVLAGVIIYVRYRHIVLEMNHSSDEVEINKCNNFGLLFGVVCVLGVSIVGNFQATNSVHIHYVGAGMAFGIGFVYMSFQTRLSHLLMRKFKIPGNSTCIRGLRVFLCFVDAVAILLMISMTIASKNKGPGQGIPSEKWTSDHPGYTEHLIATISEWLIAIFTVAFFFTFRAEFKYFGMKPPEVEYYTSRRERRSNNRVQPAVATVQPAITIVQTAFATAQPAIATVQPEIATVHFHNTLWQ